MEKKIYIENKYNYKLSAIINKINDSKQITVICHASGSHKDSRATYNLAKILTENEINNIRFDFSAHGESEGDMLEVTNSMFISDLETVIDYLRKDGYKEIVLVGYSLGGRIATMIDVDKYNVKKLILWAPAIIYKNKIKLLKDKFLRKKKEKIALKKGYCELHKSIRSAKYFEDERKTDYFSVAIKINRPILLISGDEDDFVDCKHAYKFKEKNKNSNLIIIKGENHGFKKDDKNLEYVCKETAKFIKSR